MDTMNLHQKINTMEMQAKLSTLWIFSWLNILLRDIHEFFRPGFLDEIMAGAVNGNEMTEGFLLQAAILLEIPLAMVLLSRFLPSRANRWANIIVAPLAIVSVIAAGPADLDDLFFAGVEIVALLLVIWTAWTWSQSEA